MAEFVLVPVLIIGVILGILEMIFVHQDEAGMGWLSHGLHAIPVMFVFIFISMNVDYALSFFMKTQPNIWITVGIRTLIGIIAAAKISAAAAIAGRVGEKLPHTLTIAVLIVVAPYIWELALCGIPFIKTLPLNGCPVTK